MTLTQYAVLLANGQYVGTHMLQPNRMTADGVLTAQLRCARWWASGLDALQFASKYPGAKVIEVKLTDRVVTDLTQVVQ